MKNKRFRDIMGQPIDSIYIYNVFIKNMIYERVTFNCCGATET